jgi:AbrB family looped-hinge helix DNA binding protein
MKPRLTATLSSKGQLTIPKYVRDRLGLEPGTRLQIQALDEDSFAAVLVSASEEAKR